MLERLFGDRGKNEKLSNEVKKEMQPKMENPDAPAKLDVLKILLVGDAGVGKSALMSRFCKDGFVKEYIPTIGVEFRASKVEIDNRQFTLQVWDTSGQEKFGAINRSIYHGARCFIIIFDVTDKKSFEHVTKWQTDFEKHVTAETGILIVGTKTDESSRVITKEEAKEFAQSRGFEYVECSSKSGYNVANVFFTVATLWYNKVHSTNIPVIVPIEYSMDGLSDNIDSELQNALKTKYIQWNRSKIMIVGEGRAGKTALSNSIIGNPYTETDSTIGINQLTIDVKYANLTGGGGNNNENGSWGKYEKPEKEFETALARQIMLERLLNNTKDGGGINDSNNTVKNNIINQANGHVVDTTDNNSGLNTNNGAAYEQQEGVDSSLIKEKKSNANPQIDFTTKAAYDKLKYNQELIMKHLADKIQTSSNDLVVSLFDFGGQSVFNVIHHFFLTQYGVYAIVFNMENLLITEDNSEIDRENCLSYLRFWLNSIVLHTIHYDKCHKCNVVAPIVFIGTRKDKICKPKDHQTISLLLHDMFNTNFAWNFILTNDQGEGGQGRSILNFFPINNKEGRNDETTQQLMKTVENTIKDEDYVKGKKPISWLQCLDRLTELKQSYIHKHEFQSLCMEYAIESDESLFLLLFLHEVGILMWINEPALEDIIILDPLTYFVAPVTRIICKYVPTNKDPTQHSTDIHKHCQHYYSKDWRKFVEKGIMSELLLENLLKGYEEQRDKLVLFMIKFGFIVKLEKEKAMNLMVLTSTSSSNNSHEQQQQNTSDNQFINYLVPALLPSNNLTEDNKSNWTTKKVFQTCYFILSTDEELSQNTINAMNLTKEGFLPNGLFQRLIGKNVLWSQQTSTHFNINHLELYQDYVILSFGSQRFRLQSNEKYNYIQLDIEGEYPMIIHDRIYSQIVSIMSECFKTLHCFSALLYNNGASKIVVDNSLFIPLKMMIESKEKDMILMNPIVNRLLNETNIEQLYGYWIHDNKNQMLSYYDVFISYRWGNQDSKFTELLYDMFTNATIGDNNRAIQVFLDKKRLTKGLSFRNEFVKCLIASTVFVPIVSTNALHNMTTHNPNKVDNLLLEWIISLELMEMKNNTNTTTISSIVRDKIKLTRIYPLFFITPGVTQIFPEIVPTATLEAARVMLQENEIPLINNTDNNNSIILRQVTVKYIIDKMFLFLGRAGDSMSSDDDSRNNNDEISSSYNDKCFKNVFESAQQVVMILKDSIKYQSITSTNTQSSETSNISNNDIAGGAISEASDVTQPTATVAASSSVVIIPTTTTTLKSLIERVKIQLEIHDDKLSPVKLIDFVIANYLPEYYEECNGKKSLMGKFEFIVEKLGV